MRQVWAEQALVPEGWRDNVLVTISEDGRIAGVEAGAEPRGAERVGVLLPAPANSHSHAFQRAMAGLTERRGSGSTDSFWTWRQLMYSFLDRITPEQVEGIAAFVQMEMLEAGFATNVEFHYLHHQPDGTPYGDIAEMSARIAAAAERSGVGLTLLPVAYQYGGMDKRPLVSGQMRFGNDTDRYARLLEGAAKAIGKLPPDAVLGVAPHSLRAVAPSDLAKLAVLRPGTPLHMHLAETLQEVEEVRSCLGKRPVEWMLENVDLSPRWTLIHITQMKPRETEVLAATGAVAGLCPLTEASLGDGIFDGVRWMERGGTISVGSDSNIRISLAEELRQLETSQRLRDHNRAALASESHSTGRLMFEATATGGAKAAGRPSGRIAVGRWADILALDLAQTDLEGLRGDTILDAFIFAGDNAMVSDVWAAGRHMVTGGRHVKRAEIEAAYRAAVRPLRQARW